MKKSALFLFTILLVSLLAVHASAASQSHPHSGSHCVCGNSAADVGDHECENITWTALPTSTKDFSSLKSGNYYLTRNVTVTAAGSITGKQISICLNGYNISTTGVGVFGYLRSGATLRICDCSGQQAADGTWSWGGTITANRSGGSRQYGGVTKVNAGCRLDIYGGNYVGATGGKITSGGVFTVCNDYFSDFGSASNSDPSLDTRLNIYNGHITGGDVSSNGGAINSWHSVQIGLYGGTITGGTAASGGCIHLSSSTAMTVKNTTVIGGNPATVWAMEGDRFVKQYTTISAAISGADSGQKLRLTGDINEAATLAGDHIIDLAGNDLSGVTVSNIRFMDSTTDGYTDTLAGKLTPISGKPILHTKDSFTSKRYLALEENGSYTYHRYYMAITKLTLKPGNAGMGYKATFIADEKLKSTVDTYGFTMWVSEKNKISRGFSSDSFGGTQELTARIDNFLNKDLTDAQNEDRANMPVYASTYLKLSDGSTVESTAVYYTLRQMLELANDQYENYSKTQQNALLQLSHDFSGSMICWDIDRLHHVEGSVWQSVTASSFLAMLEKTTYKGATVYSIPQGTYLLTEDINIGKRPLIVLADNKVDICLNGYTVTGATRMIRNFGLLNICDCHDTEEEGTILGTMSIDTTSTSKNYAPVLYCYYNSVTNLHGGHLKATGTLSGAGVLAISHDGDYTDATQVPAVFNMYGGSISGGWTSGPGGNVALWNYSTMNIYGGTIYGGSASDGGAIHISQGTVSIYGGTVRNNEARSGNGGNINASTSGTLKLYGGAVTGGSAAAETVDEVTTPDTGLGGGIYLKTGSLLLQGDTQVIGNTGSDIYLGHQATLDTKELSASAQIGVDGDIHGIVSGNSAHADRFVSNNEAYKIAAINGCTALIPTAVDTAAVTASETSFRVGYSITDITPTESGLVMSSYGNPNGRKTDGTVNYPLKATVVAISDQANNTILMITVDLQNPPETLMETVTQRISQVTGVPSGNIYISATHTHNVPTPGTSSEGNKRYQNLYVDALIQGALTAMADRAPAQMSIGSFDTQGMNYSRHYYYYDENSEKVYFGDQFGSKPAGVTIYRVRQGDETMHMLAFSRTDKQPVLLVNWRAHPHRSGGKEKYTVDADVIGATREYIHNNTDYLFAYYQGAAGNMNTTSRISGETYMSGKITEYGNELGRQIVKGMANLHSVDTGLIQTKKIVYAATVDHSQDEKYEQAVALQTYYKNNPDEMDTYEEQIAVAASYGFTSYFHATRMLTKYRLGPTKDIELNIFSIGQSIGFYTAPAELWDSFSEELETLSPFEVTFCIGYCNGGVAYIPYQLDYEDSYEDVYCLFTQEDTINQMKAYYIEGLNQQYGLSQDDVILAQRRDRAEAKMREMCSIIWRAGESISYTNAAGNDIQIVEGRLYQGLPYTSAGNDEEAFLLYASSTDAQGTPVISGIDSKLVNGTSTNTRLGNDCSSAVLTAWGTVGNSSTATATVNMVVDRGCLRVGDYESDPTVNDDTKLTTAANGQQTMFEAYAQLQKADALVHNNDGAGHAIMVVSVNVVRNGSGIDPEASTVTIMEQTSYYCRNETTYYSEELGEDVYIICMVDKEMTFQKLYDTGYLPITCLELIAPVTLDAAAVTDSETEHTLDTLYSGTFTANYYVSSVTVTITDEDGNTVQSLTGFGNRGGSWRVFKLNRLLTDAPERVLGSLDPTTLPPGTYTCTYTCRFSNDQAIIVREFEFTV